MGGGGPETQDPPPAYRAQRRAQAVRCWGGRHARDREWAFLRDSSLHPEGAKSALSQEAQVPSQHSWTSCTVSQAPESRPQEQTRAHFPELHPWLPGAPHAPWCRSSASPDVPGPCLHPGGPRRHSPRAGDTPGGPLSSPQTGAPWGGPHPARPGSRALSKGRRPPDPLSSRASRLQGLRVPSGLRSIRAWALGPRGWLRALRAEPGPLRRLEPHGHLSSAPPTDGDTPGVGHRTRGGTRRTQLGPPLASNPTPTPVQASDSFFKPGVLALQLD